MLNIHKGVMKEHFELLDQIKQEKDEKKLERLCKKDISLAKHFIKEWTAEENRLSILSKGKPAPVILLPQYPSFDKLASIYEKQGKYKDAIEICKRAIDFGFPLGGSRSWYARVERIKKKGGL